MIFIHTDGGIDATRGFCAFVVQDANGNYIGSCSKIVTGTSNECEYWAIIAAFDWLMEQHPYPVAATILCDSRLVVEQIARRWKCKEPRLQILRDTVDHQLAIIARDTVVTFEQIPRSRNRNADYLCNLAKIKGPKTDFSTPIR